VKQDSSPDKDLNGMVINGSCNAVSNVDVNNGIQTKSNLNGINVDDEIKTSEKCLELPVIPNWDSTHQGSTGWPWA
ncbi:putative Acyl-CoA-binding domain-containing protein, partial [Naja naja]